METLAVVLVGIFGIGGSLILLGTVIAMFRACLLYTSDAADDIALV